MLKLTKKYITQFSIKTILLGVSIILISCNQDPVFSPTAILHISPRFADIGTVFILDASKSFDSDGNKQNLLFRWDFQNDSIWDSEFESNSTISKKLESFGMNIVQVQCIDRDGLVSSITDSVYIVGGYEEDTLTDSRNNAQYKTIKINDRWWMAENLRIGRVISSEHIQSDNNTIEMYVYDDDSLQNYLSGGFYLWEEAMNYTTNENRKGICPEGWKIPSLDEWNILADGFPPIALFYYFGDGDGKISLGFSGWFSLINYVQGYYYPPDFVNKGHAGGFWSSSIMISEEFIFKPAIMIQNDPNKYLDTYSGFLIMGDVSIKEDPGVFIRSKSAYSVRCIKEE